MSGVERFDIQMKRKAHGQGKLPKSKKTTESKSLPVIREVDEGLQPGPSREVEQPEESPQGMFTQAGLTELNKPYFLTAFALDNFDNRYDYLRKRHPRKINTFDQWAEVVYFSKHNLPINPDNSGYVKFRRKLEDIKEGQKQEVQHGQQKVAQQEEQQLEELDIIEPIGKPKTISGDGLKTGSGFIACPNNIVDDVSRLEVLIGGKRTGNNSLEIINEAADICQQLFQHFIDELADGYYSN